MKNLAIICVVFTIISFISCSVDINGSLSHDGSASMYVKTSLGPRITGFIKTMAAAAGGQADGAILDGASISNSMSSSPGIASAVLKNTNPSAIEGPVRISRVGDFLALSGSRGFIFFEQTAASGGSCIININAQNASGIISLLSPDIKDYLNALMAPVATGDKMTKNEYLETVSLFYGMPISNEIASSGIRAVVEFPGAITSVKGGTFTGRTASFDIPLVDLLVLENPVILEVRWK